MRRLAAIYYEAARAALSLGGIRILKQAKVTVGATSEGTYTLTEGNTRRVIIAHDGTDDDIRFVMGATAAATDFPLKAGEYFRVDAAAGDVLHFYNVTGAGIDVHVLEVD